MLIDKKTYEGKIVRDPYGSWEDCSPGLYLDNDDIESILEEFRNCTVRLTIEVISDEKG